MTNQTDVQVEQADALQDLMAKQDALASQYRDQGVPEGAILGESDIGGQMVRWKKPSSLVRNGKTPLPERFEAFDKYGKSSMLPTAMMGVMLSKPRADAPGERAFHTHSGGKTRSTCLICPTPKVPLQELCPWCAGAKGMKHSFYSEFDLVTHKRRLHPDEYEESEKMLERAERRAAADSQERLAQAILESLKADRTPKMGRPPKVVPDA